jgi:outer membrane protein assembly factor BamB
VLLFGSDVLRAEEAVTDPSTPPAGVIANYQLSVPTGDYGFVTFTLQEPIFTYFGGIRAGRMRIDDGVGLREAGGWLELKNGRLTGSFQRVNLPATITVDASVKDGVITGTATVGGPRGTHKTPLTGNLVTERELAQKNAVPPHLSWPAAQGPAMGGCSTKITGIATVDRVEDLRVVWRSEENDIGRGMGNINRFMTSWPHAGSIRTGSGCAAPVLANGRIFFKYFIPCPRDPKTPEIPLPSYRHLTESTAAEQILSVMHDPLAAPSPSPEIPDLDSPSSDIPDLEPDKARKTAPDINSIPLYAREKIFQSCDDVVVCMDAASGKTLWKAVIAGRGANYQHHKSGPYDMSPTYHQGRIFALGMSGWLYAIDAASGRPLWEVRSDLDLSNALLAVGDILVAPADNEWGGYETATGRLLWKTGGGRAMSTFSVWSKDGRDYLIGILGSAKAPAGLGCLEATTGKVLWNLPVRVVTGGRGLGPGGITVSGDTLLVYQDNGPVTNGAPIAAALAAYRLTPKQAEPLWQVSDRTDGQKDGVDAGGNNMGCIHGESVPVVVHGKFVFTPDLRTLNLADGKTVDQAAGPFPQNGGYLQVNEDLVMARVDGTHGGIQCGFYKVSPEGRITTLTEKPWSPPVGDQTTSYHHPIFYPMAAGRLFMRQGDGIYCWDLRNPSIPSEPSSTR